MKILGVGLSRTGTLTLHKALEILGYKCIHWAPERLADVVDGSNQNPFFRRYDDVDVVTDIPAAYFYKELWDAYPDCRFILTTRDIESWYRSVAKHYGHVCDSPLQNLVYGSEIVTEFLYKKKFKDHNDAVRAMIPSDKLLEMDIPSGRSGWDQLCHFLKKDIPQRDFPHRNKL